MIRGWDYNIKRQPDAAFYMSSRAYLAMSGWARRLRFSNLVLIAMLYQVDGSKYNMGEPKTNDGI